MNNDLFITQPDFTKTAGKQLSQDPSKWTKEILDEFFTQYPQFMASDVDIEYKRKDADKGYAVATVMVEDIAVPVIVNNWAMSDIDVMYKNGTPLPLSQETLGTIFGNKAPFKNLTPVEKDPTRNSFLTPLINLDMNNNYQSVKTSSLIEKVGSTVSKVQKESLLKSLADDPQIGAGFELNGNFDLVEKIAKLVPTDNYSFNDSLSRNLDRDIHYIYKEGRFNYKAVFGNSSVDDPITVDLDSSDYLTKNGAYKCSNNEPLEKIAHSDGFDSPKIYNIDGSDKQLLLYKLGEDMHHTYTQDLDPVSTEKVAIDGSKPTIGDYGTFVRGEHAVDPFEVRGVLNNSRHYEVEGFDGFNKVAYIPSRALDKIIPHEELTNTYYIPTDYQFVKVGNSQDANDIVKLHRNLEEHSDHYFTYDPSGSYNLFGPKFSKYGSNGHETKSLTKNDAVWSAIQCGANENDIEKMAGMKDKPYKKMYFTSELSCPISLDKVAEHLSDAHDKALTSISHIFPNLVKSAAVLTDKTSVDAVLSLGLINKKNIAEFITEIPTFEYVVSSLARLLLSVRLGASAVPEAAIQEAMHGLTTVVTVLRQLSGVQK